MAELTCPICSSDYVNPQIFPEHRNKDGAGYACAVCGVFFITRTAEVNSRSQKPDSRFPAWIRQYEENQLDPPFITSNLLDEVTKNLPNYTPLEKQLILLKAIERKTKYPGFWESLGSSLFHCILLFLVLFSPHVSSTPHRIPRCCIPRDITGQ